MSDGRRRFQAGDVVRTYNHTAARAEIAPWLGKVLAISSDGRLLAAVDLGITLGPEYPAGSHVVRAVRVDDVYLVRKAGW